jgi:hypothetical protein
MKQDKQGQGRTVPHATQADEHQGNASKPVSLAPLDFEQALADLLQVPADKVQEKMDAMKKRASKKR